ncbi:MAG: YdeI/OmpD-associated family protein [Acholeplasmataceae bacterium]|nr:YdeI/OmpD-associated family protein [Acholeplasmataceae bacterium]
MSQKNPKVDAFIFKEKKWQDEYAKLREIALDSELFEDLKWGVPCYTWNNGNVVLIHGFKEYCAILFVKGALLKDTHQMLIQQTENVQSARQIRFTHLEEIISNESKIKSYINQATQIEKSGLKVEFKKETEIKHPIEFMNKLDEMPELEGAFKKLTPGRQRAYILYFSAPKQTKTRESRIEKYIPYILDGKGMDD